MKTLFFILALIPSFAFAERAVMENTAATNKTIYVNTSLQRVGISTTSPQYSLDVAGDARANYFRGNGSLLTGIVISTANLQSQVNAIAVSTGVLTTGLANEISARQAADLAIGLTTGTLRSDLTSEANTRSAADLAIGLTTGTLRADLTSEVSSRAAADLAIGLTTGTLRSDLTSEAGIRAAADSALSAQVSTAVYTTGSYANPSWLTSLSTSKIDLSTVTTAINASTAPLSALHLAIQDPTGFVNRSNVISFNNGTRQFSISGNHDVWINGIRYTKPGASITIGDTTGLHVVYYNMSGTLVEGAFPGVEYPLLGSVYWNTAIDKGLLGDERHGISMPWADHKWIHESIGARYLSGLTGTFGNTTFSMTSGTFADEDIIHSIVAPSTCAVLYKEGSSDYKFLTAQTSYYLTIGGLMKYNSGTALADVPTNNYVASWAFATTDPTQPIAFIIGQRVDTTIAAARTNNTYESLTLGTLPSPEYKLLYRVILRNDGTPYEEVQDLRNVSNLPSGTYTATSHAILTDLGLSASGHPYDAPLGFASYDAMVASDALKVAKAGDFMAGQLTTSSSMTALGGFVGNLIGNAATVTNGAYLPSNQMFTGYNTFSSSMTALQSVEARGGFWSNDFYTWRTGDSFDAPNGHLNGNGLELFVPGTYAERWSILAGALTTDSLVISNNLNNDTTFRPSGNVGLGVSSPDHRLDVLGGIHATSTMTSAGFYGPATGLTNIPSAQLSGTVPIGLVNLSSVTTALAGKENTDATIVKEADLTANDFNVAANVVSLDYTNGQAASAANKGFLTSADWSTFNSKQSAGSYITALTGDVTASGPGSVAATVVNDSHSHSASTLSGVVQSTATGTYGISITGNSGTATALAANPADCTLPNVALGIGANGAAVCAQPSDITGNAATATTAANNVLKAGDTMLGSLTIPTNGNLGSGLTITNSSTGDSLEFTANIISLDGGSNGLYIDNHGTQSTIFRNASNATIASISQTGQLTATSFHGSGANLTDLPAGGVSVSTETIVLHSGGDVFVASGTFGANIGMTHPVAYSTITITGVRCYTLITSSVAATTFNVARSTDTGATTTYSYLFNTPISVAANTKYSAWSVPDQNATYSPPYALSLHTVGVPASGTLPSEYGCEIKYWRRLD